MLPRDLNITTSEKYPLLSIELWYDVEIELLTEQ